MLQADLTDEDACHRLVRETTHWSGGRHTALVNHAAVQPVQPLPGMTAAEWRTVVDTDLTSVFACTQAAAAHMRAHGGGTVTHIASVEAAHPAPATPTTARPKAAVVTHARAAALEYGPDGIRVNTVSPGLIDREGLAQAWPEGVRRWPAAAPNRPAGPARGRGRRVRVPGLAARPLDHRPRPDRGRRRLGPPDVVSTPGDLCVLLRGAGGEGGARCARNTGGGRG